MSTGMNVNSGSFQLPTLDYEGAINHLKTYGNRALSAVNSENLVYLKDSLKEKYSSASLQAQDLYQRSVSSLPEPSKVIGSTAETVSTMANAAQKTLTPFSESLKETLASAGSSTQDTLTSFGTTISDKSAPIGNFVKDAAPYVGAAVEYALPAVALTAPTAIALYNRRATKAACKKQLAQMKAEKEQLNEQLLSVDNSVKDKHYLAEDRATQLSSLKSQLTPLKERKTVSIPGILKSIATFAAPMAAIPYVGIPTAVGAGLIGLASRYFANRQKASADAAILKEIQQQEEHFEKQAEYFRKAQEAHEYADGADNLLTVIKEQNGELSAKHELLTQKEEEFQRLTTDLAEAREQIENLTKLLANLQKAK